MSSILSNPIFRTIAAIILTFIVLFLLYFITESYRKDKNVNALVPISLSIILCCLLGISVIGILQVGMQLHGLVSVKENTSAPEVFDLPDGRTVVAGTLDELMQWIDDNAITHVETLSQLDSRDSLTRWRELRPEGVPSQEVRDLHDRDEFMHYAVIRQ